MFSRTHANIGSRLCPLLIVMLGLCLAACFSSRYIAFNPDPSETPIMMFNRYRLEVYGFAPGTPYMNIDIYYAAPIEDTTSVDTLPVFILDSICFAGACIDSPFCSRPWDWREYNEYIRETTPEPANRQQEEYYDWLKEKNPEFPGIYRGVPLRYEDLWFQDGIVMPSGYFLHPVVGKPLPQLCVTAEVQVEFRARLLDRKSHGELAREVKTVRFKVEPKKFRYVVP